MSQPLARHHPASPLARERHSLLRSILERPEEDARRLVYADWLEEHGWAARDQRQARAIRLRHVLDTQPCTCSCSSQGACAWHASVNEEINLCREISWSVPDSGPVLVSVRGGFVVWVGLSMEQFLDEELLAGLFSRHPITRVTLVGKEPHRVDRNTTAVLWQKCDLLNHAFYGHTLPDWMVEAMGSVMPGRGHWVFVDRAAAIRALERVCVDHGRRLAQLPPLDWSKFPMEPKR